MDSTRRPMYSGPIFPIASRTEKQVAPHHMKGKIVGVRSGRSGEVTTTRILTIKLVEPYQDIETLLHAEVDIQVQITPRSTEGE